MGGGNGEREGDRWSRGQVCEGRVRETGVGGESERNK